MYGDTTPRSGLLPAVLLESKISPTLEMRMPLSLPEAHHHPLARSPLAVVVFQVRFEQNLSVGDTNTGLLFHEQLGGHDGSYPVVEPQQMMGAVFQLDPLGIGSQVSTTPPSRGLRMKSADGLWVVSLMPDFVALETTAYTTWKYDFRDRIRPILESLNEHVKPRVEERIGLRYVNRIVEPTVEAPTDFEGLISASILGPIADEFWGAGIKGTQQQLELEISDEIRGLLRHGTIPRSSGVGIDGYLLDLDLFRQQPRAFDVEKVVQTSNELNEAATGLFKASLTPDYLAQLGGEAAK
jgi:uncharacterized protein (TIGR04255 family)